MTGKYVVLKVLVSSPDDVAEERMIVNKLIQQVNDVAAHFVGIHLEFVGWEKNVHPGFATEPQAVVNDQIGDDYDVFVGILWSRFGTPTQSAGSGTEEEFLKAYERHKTGPDDLQIMFYFSRVPVIWDECDLDQLQRVRDFKAKLPQMGGLYSEYTSKEEFENALRIHFGNLVHNWGKTWGVGKKKTLTIVDQPPGEPSTHTAPEPPADVSDETEPEEAGPEEGFLDLIERGTDRMTEVGKIGQRMTDAMNQLSERLKARTASAEALGIPTTVEDRKKVQILVSAMATDMLDYVQRMELEIPLFADSYSNGIDAYGKAGVLLADFDADNTADIEEALETVKSLRITMQDTKEKISNFRGVVSRLPRISTSFNQARVKATRMLASLVTEFQRAVNLSKETEALFAGIIDRQ